MPAFDPKSIDDLNARLAKLESAAGALRPPATDPAVANRMATLEGSLKSIDEKVGVVARRTDDLTTTARDIGDRNNTVATALADLSQQVVRLSPSRVEQSDIDALATRIAALERSAKTVEAELAKRTVREPGDHAARLATLAVALDAAAGRGEPLGASLAAVIAMGVDRKVLAALEPFASTGVPAANVLARELLGLLPALAKSVGTTPRDGGILERLAANAEKLVRVRPIDDTPGDEPATVLARIEMRAAQSDIAGALAAVDQLPATARPIAAPWIARAQARSAALATSRQLVLDTLAALGKGP